MCSGFPLLYRSEHLTFGDRLLPVRADTGAFQLAMVVMRMSTTSASVTVANVARPRDSCPFSRACPDCLLKRVYGCPTVVSSRGQKSSIPVVFLSGVCMVVFPPRLSLTRSLQGDMSDVLYLICFGGDREDLLKDGLGLFPRFLQSLHCALHQRQCLAQILEVPLTLDGQ